MFDKMLTKIRYAVVLAALIALTGGCALPAQHTDNTAVQAQATIKTPDIYDSEDAAVVVNRMQRRERYSFKTLPHRSVTHWVTTEQRAFSTRMT